MSQPEIKYSKSIFYHFIGLKRNYGIHDYYLCNLLHGVCLKTNHSVYISGLFQDNIVKKQTNFEIPKQSAAADGMKSYGFETDSTSRF